MTLTTDLADATADGKTCIVLLRDGSVITNVKQSPVGTYSSFHIDWWSDGVQRGNRKPSEQDITRVITAEEYAAMIAALEDGK